ncbi:MAG: hypothetical protein QXN57_01165 [Desulfurococcaceae archaeon]
MVNEKAATVEVYRAEPISLESTNAISLYESNIEKIVLRAKAST